ncbi:alpha/beta hydrolase [Amycolatopsis nigrescens]|uniref:alpha/beta hydrolase n=1 Tax=Amycolatopsis nigrescens TaxID=381445 RepID=UPI0004770699|nr:alpha/beta hydrolase [Amycolatopsis nigrescens]
MTASHRSRLLLCALAVLLLCGTAPAAGARTHLAWGDCPNPGNVPLHGLKCTTLRVPLDHRRPGGRTIELAVSKMDSTNPAKRRGVLLMNNGGPGIPSLLMPARGVALGLPDSLRESYDLIGFDPRGVGESTPVSCGLPPDYTGAIQPYPRDAADVRQRAGEVRAVAEGCARHNDPAVLAEISTANTARDMNLIVDALGESKASYFGVSYGTYLGAVFASRYPSRTDRVVLDSALGPAGLDETQLRSVAKGFEDRFPDFARWAAERASTYHLGDTPELVRAKYFELAGQQDRSGQGAAFRGDTLNGLTGSMTSDDGFPALAARWRDLSAGAAGPLGTPADNTISAQTAVLCNDNAWPRSVRHYQRAVAEDRLRFPMFGAAAANVSPCAFWPVRPEPRIPITGNGPSNVLIVQNLRDPITPLTGARATRTALGPRARMVTVDQGGHGAYLVTGQNRCGRDAVTDYLTAGAFPPADTHCAAEPR